LKAIYKKVYNHGMDKDIDSRNNKQVKLFDIFIKDTKPSVNRTVQAALKGVYEYSQMKTEENKKKPFRDAEKWYIIQVDEGKYFVDLPKDCVEIPESLLNV